MSENPYNEGKEAYLSGQGENPYPLGYEFEQWNKGWWATYDEDAGNFDEL